MFRFFFKLSKQIKGIVIKHISWTMHEKSLHVLGKSVLLIFVLILVFNGKNKTHPNWFMTWKYGQKQWFCSCNSLAIINHYRFSKKKQKKNKTFRKFWKTSKGKSSFFLLFFFLLLISVFCSNYNLLYFMCNQIKDMWKKGEEYVFSRNEQLLSFIYDKLISSLFFLNYFWPQVEKVLGFFF